ILPLLLWLAYRREGGERLLLLVESLLVSAALVGTLTRGALLAAAVGLVAGAAFFGLRRVPRRGVVIGAIVMLLVIGLGTIAAWAAGASPARLRNQETIKERIDLWRVSVRMLKDRPVTGWGPDQFAEH